MRALLDQQLAAGSELACVGVGQLRLLLQGLVAVWRGWVEPMRAPADTGPW